MCGAGGDRFAVLKRPSAAVKHCLAGATESPDLIVVLAAQRLRARSRVANRRATRVGPGERVRKPSPRLSARRRSPMTGDGDLATLLVTFGVVFVGVLSVAYLFGRQARQSNRQKA